ncbi:MAG: CRTAC1 family protein, partial [Gemmatimonadetes bacterium]|nr:CRTAC1 family protein [Gemmatimonadota bacterium]
PHVLAVLMAAVCLACEAATDTVTLEPTPLFEAVVEGPFAEDGGATRGVGWADFDGDGDPDLYTANTSGQENVLYHNLHFGPPGHRPQGGLSVGAGSIHPGFQKNLNSDPSSPSPTTTFPASSEGVSWIDYDGDGDLDLFVVNRNGERDNLFRNDGSGGFTPVTDSGLTDRTAGASMACWADVNGDGWLDVFVIGYDGASNLLFRNEGGHRFVEVAESPMSTGTGEARACGWADANGDGLPDMYVANNRDAPNRFFLNLGGWQFEEVMEGHLVEAIGYSYGVSWADHDEDGDLDLFVANFDRRNVLYRNSGGGELTPDFSSLLSMDEGGASKGHAWADYDLDGDLDLFVANGTYGPDMRNFIYLNDGHGGFSRDMRGDVAMHADTSAGVAWADYDLDGDLDLFVASWGSSDQVNRLYRNTTSETSGRGWLSVSLQGDWPNTFAVGAKVTCVVTIEGERRRLTRWNWPITGYGSQNQMLAHFGLGDATRVDSLIVEWPDGAENVLTEVEPGTVQVTKSRPPSALRGQESALTKEVKAGEGGGRLNSVRRKDGDGQRPVVSDKGS